VTGSPDASEKDPKPKRCGPRTAAGKAKFRLNAQKHQLFAKSGGSHHSSERADDLEVDYCKDATSNEELGYLRSLAQVQAHIEDIRRVRMAIWNAALETAESHLDEASDLAVFRPRIDSPIIIKAKRMLDIADYKEDDSLEFLPERIRSLALKQVSDQLFTLTGYEQRAQGRRRKLMREIMRIRVDQKWKSG